MAPILVTDYTWTQTDSSVSVIVPIKSFRRSDIDVYTSSIYIKMNARPFIFELFLYSEIDEEKSKCSFIENAVVFQLAKAEPKKWAQLAANVSREEKIQLRQAIVDKNHDKIACMLRERSKRQYELNQLAIQRQIKLGGDNRQLVEEVKNEEKEKVNRELDEWRKTSVKNSNECKIIEIAERCSANLNIGKREEVKNAIPEDESQPNDVIKEAKSSSKGTCQLSPPCEALQNTKLTAAYDFPIPRPRSTGKIEVSFTAREFPTPTRESKLEEEQEWLKKQYAARKAAGFVAEDLRPEECDPVWLKDKGDTFYSHKNYLGAVSAYSHAIKIGSKMPDLYSNRAAAHFQLGNFHKALEDCSTALELLTPHVRANEDARFTCHVRRAAVLCRLGLPEKAVPDYEQALKLRPGDVEVRSDYEKAKAVAEESEESE